MKILLVAALVCLVGPAASSKVPVVSFASYKDGTLFLLLAEAPKEVPVVKLCFPKPGEEKRMLPIPGGGLLLAQVTPSRHDPRMLMVPSKVLPGYVALISGKDWQVYRLTVRTGEPLAADAPNLLAQAVEVPW